MRELIITILILTFMISFGNVNAAADIFQNTELNSQSFFKKEKDKKYFQKGKKGKKTFSQRFFKKEKKEKNSRFQLFKRLFYKKNKTTPPRKGDDLWILKLIYLVALLSIITFALSAIMLATGGMSSLWLTLMIVGGIIGVLPFLIVGVALLFQ